jgi:hypothetical protein
MSFRFDANKVAQATAYMLKSMNEKRHNFIIRGVAPILPPLSGVL